MLIFLDIDGVMVPAKGWKRPEFLEDGFPAFSSKASSTLQSLISRDTTIILTTSHRSKFSIEKWKVIFKNRGINLSNLKSLPENEIKISRKEEILNWFYINTDYEHFVIIDDDKSLNELPSFLKDNWVQTSSYIGLTEEHLQIVSSILDKGLLPA